MGQLTQSGSQYPESLRLQAIANYAVIGVATRVAELMNVPDRTINQWVNSDWGIEALTEIRQQNTNAHISAYNRLTEKALEKAERGIDNLDGELSPSDIKALTVAASASTDKSRLLQNQATSISSSSTGMAALAEQFRQLSQQWDEKQADVVAVQEQTDTE